MSRLTTNKPVDEMSMLELAYNSCYAKDGKAMYRDFSVDTDARDFVRQIMQIELPKDDEEFDEAMLECLQCDPITSIVGTIALLYRNLWAMADMRETLKAYEDKQEQGLLIELPCKVGDTLYHKREDEMYEYKFIGVVYDILNKEWMLETALQINGIRWQKEIIPMRCVGKTVFLTAAKAEEALAKMGGKV